MKKRMASALLALCMMFALLPVQALAVDTVKYKLNGGYIYFDPATGTIVDADSTIYAGSTVRIPEEIGGVPVKTIGRGAFDYTQVKKVYLPDSVETIETNAFECCGFLEYIKFGAGVTAVADNVFGNCTKLKEIEVDSGNRVYSSQDGVLFNKNKTELVIYPRNASSGETYQVPYTVTKIGNRAFVGYAGSKIKLPAGLTEIGEYAFLASGLRSISIPDGITKIRQGTFSGCGALSSVEIPNSVTVIERAAFYITGLKDVYYDGTQGMWNKIEIDEYNDDLSNVRFHFVTPTPTKPYKITNVVSGVHVYWDELDGVDKYGLWRSETGKNGTYKWVANPTVPHFTDTKVESGKTYFYKVSYMFDGEHTEKSEPIGIVYTSTPDIDSRKNTAAGVELSWKAVPGATGYAIYRKSYSGSDAWVRVGTIEGNKTFTWTDESVKNNNGSEYRYTIRALGGADMKTLSGCRNTGRTMVRLSSQVLKSAVKADATSIKCTWTTSSRVTGYEVRFMVGDEVFKTFTVGNYKTGVKTFKGLKAGEDYTVQVRTYKKVDGVGSFYSDWSVARNVSL